MNDASVFLFTGESNDAILTDNKDRLTAEGYYE